MIVVPVLLRKCQIKKMAVESDLELYEEGANRLLRSLKGGVPAVRNGVQRKLGHTSTWCLLLSVSPC